MARLEFRQIEGLLYGLGSPPEPNLARPRYGAGQHRPPGPSAPAREVIGRADLAQAAQRLAPTDLTVLLEHYVHRRPQPGYARRRAIRALRLELDGA